ncbi:transposase [Acholeplasma manati]|uniref:Transposase n=1 Tax=Paracholeplasma manati TaxID=591373 RepID=A0ABT2Y3L2_9MOLU|nr:transposase [Paracholeplasma manati]MCV2231324.1 transposase [Paracholeplasma manati]
MPYKALKTRLYLNPNQHQFLLSLMRASRSLYNQALYNVRQHFIKTNGYLSYNDNYQLLKDSEHYRYLSTTQGQMVIRKVDEAMKGFFVSLKSKVKQTIRLPRYLKKDTYYPIYDRMVYKPNNEIYTLPRSNFIKKVSKELEKDSKQIHKHTYELNEADALSLDIQTPECIQNKEIKEITIKSYYDGKYIEVIYVYLDKESVNPFEGHTETMGIDFGYNNLAFCSVTNNEHLLLDGKRLKSMNQFYHKRIAKLASIRPNQNVLTKQMIHLMDKRNHQMDYGIYKAAKLIINHAIENKVKQIIIGYNDTFKDERLSDTYNQWTKSIPIARLRDRIVYLAEQIGIETKVINEAYTSKASYLDHDDFVKGDFSGVRIKRGLYKSLKGTLINADQNASLNMIRKGNPDAIWIGNKGVNTPKRTYLFGV